MHMSTHRRLMLLGGLIGLALAPGLRSDAQQPEPPAAGAPAQADEALERPRLLVVPAAEAERQDLTREAVTLICKEVLKNGYPVVSPDLADRLNRSPRGAEGRSPGQRLGSSAHASVLVTVDVRADRERKQQGRYRVELSAHVRVTGVESATVLLEERPRERAVSFDGFRDAHLRAVEVMGEGIGRRLVERLKQLETEEKENGALFTVGVFAEGTDRAFAAALNGRLREIERIVPASVSLVQSVPGKHYHEFRLRYRGRSHGLATSLYEIIRKMMASEKEKKDQRFDLDFATSPRRVLLFVTIPKDAPTTSIDEEVKRLVDSLVGQVLEGHESVLKGKRIAVEPTWIPSSQGPKAKLETFARSYLRVYDAAERDATAAGSRDAAEAALEKGPVTIEGQEYKTLRAARERLDQLGAEFKSSRAGTLATDIAKRVGAALEKGRLDVLPPGSDMVTVLDRIKREATLYGQEGAVDPKTIAELNPSGAGAMVLTSLRPFLESYVLRIAVIDTATGIELVQLSRILDQRFKQDLDKAFQP